MFNQMASLGMGLMEDVEIPTSLTCLIISTCGFFLKSSRKFVLLRTLNSWIFSLFFPSLGSLAFDIWFLSMAMMVRNISSEEMRRKNPQIPTLCHRWDTLPGWALSAENVSDPGTGVRTVVLGHVWGRRKKKGVVNFHISVRTTGQTEPKHSNKEIRHEELTPKEITVERNTRGVWNQRMNMIDL